MVKGPKSRNIMSIAVMIIPLFASLAGMGQYYYKDLVTTREINDNFRLYKSNRLKKVKLNSFQGDVPVTEGFICEQNVDLNRNEIVTYTQTADRGESFFTASYNPDGLLVKTVDSSESTVSSSLYRYDSGRRLLQIEQQTEARDKSSRTTERHSWQYTETGQPLTMLRVKNGTDSTRLHFVVDDRGNVVEENGEHKGQPLPGVLYYYDEKNRLTDVVRYNPGAKRLLPDYIFEYEENGELAAMTIVPEGSTDYQKWYYSYDDNGLKLVEFCYNKKKELLGKIEYDYTQANQ